MIAGAWDGAKNSMKLSPNAERQETYTATVLRTFFASSILPFLRSHLGLSGTQAATIRAMRKRWEEVAIITARQLKKKSNEDQEAIKFITFL